MKNPRLLLCIMFSSLTFSAMADSANYLVKPTGKFNVSVIKHQLTNTNICPDYFYQESHGWFYKDTAGQDHCHRLYLYLYYPTNNKSGNYLNYYANDIPQVRSDINDKVIESKNVHYAEEVIKHEEKVTSYVLASGEIVNQKFPLIVFSPGMGFNSYYYQNFITNLVSHGYIVAAIDSAYNQQLYDSPNQKYLLQSPFTFESGVSSLWQPKSNLDQASSDFNFVITQLKTNSIHDPIIKYIDFNQIGGFGQSLGARAIYANSVSQNTQLKAAVAMEIGRDKTLLQNNEVPIPFMFMNAANMGTSDKEYFGAPSSFNLSSNNFLIKMTPNESNTTYSSHMTFSDFSTLRYANKLNELSNLAYNQKFSENDFNEWYGTGDGYKFTADVNSYLVNFFDHYLKHKSSSTFTSCTALNKTSLMICGDDKGKHYP